MNHPIVDWLTSGPGRVALAAFVYALIAFAKLIPAVRNGAGKAGKLGAVLILGFGAAATVWAAGASVWTGISVLVSTSGGAVLGHETIESVAKALLPLVASRAPWLATVLRAVFAPSAPPLAELRADREMGGAP